MMWETIQNDARREGEETYKFKLLKLRDRMIEADRQQAFIEAVGDDKNGRAFQRVQRELTESPDEFSWETF